MSHSVVGLVLLSLVNACVIGCFVRPNGNDGHAEEFSESVEVKSNEFIQGYSGKATLLIEPLELGAAHQIAIRWERSVRSCDVTADVARSWNEVRALAMGTVPEVTENLSLNPNRSSLSVVLAFGRQVGEREYQAWYVEGEEEMRTAVEAVWRILDECEVGVDFGTLVGTGAHGLPIYHERPKHRSKR